jgi:hypothetical protein
MTDEIPTNAWQPLTEREIERLLKSLDPLERGRLPLADRQAVLAWAAGIRIAHRDLERVLEGALEVDFRDGEVVLVAWNDDGRLVPYGVHRPACPVCECLEPDRIDPATVDFEPVRALARELQARMEGRAPEPEAGMSEAEPDEPPASTTPVTGP